MAVKRLAHCSAKLHNSDSEGSALSHDPCLLHRCDNNKVTKSAATKPPKFKQLHVPSWLIILEFAFSALLLYLLSSAPGLSLVSDPALTQNASATVVAETTRRQATSVLPALSTAGLQTKLD